MQIGKAQGAVILVVGLLLLTGAILILVTVPSWGSWITNYPVKATQGIVQQAPEQAVPVAQAVLNFVLGPLIEQIGGYIKIVGYFAGSLLALIALTVSSAGTMIIRKT